MAALTGGVGQRPQMSLEEPCDCHDGSGMAQTPRNVNSASALPLGVAGGFEIVLLGIDVWRAKVVIRLACLESADTARVNEEYSATVRDCEPLIAEGRVAFPPNPANSVFQGVRLSLRDDVGTAYEWTGGSGPGWNGRTRRGVPRLDERSRKTSTYLRSFLLGVNLRRARSGPSIRIRRVST